MSETKEVVLINGSPKSARSTSAFFSSAAENIIRSEGLHFSSVNVRQQMTEHSADQAFELMRRADALIFLFPLYFYCLPGILIRFLQDYRMYCMQHEGMLKNARIYAVVHCGFPEPDINEEAVRVIQSFSGKMGADFRFGVLIGAGSMMPGTKDAPFMKKTFSQIGSAFERIRGDISESGKTPHENILISANFPRKLYLFMGDRSWVSAARRRNLRKSDLYRKPAR